MKTARNLLITAICTLCLLAILTVCGFAFALLYDIEITLKEGGDVPHAAWLFARTVLGIILLGTACGLNAIFNFSVWIFKALNETRPGSKGS